MYFEIGARDVFPGCASSNCNGRSGNTSLAPISHPAIWRGGDCAPEPASIATGFAELDGALPGGGWPRAALTEVMLACEGIGELRLTLPALARLQAEGRSVVWISPPYRPYAPALARAGLDLARLVVVRGITRADALWAYEQALRAPECGAAFAWTGTHDERVLRRLQVAAREGCTWGVLWRRPGQRASAAAAPLRVGLAPSNGRLAVHVLKRRGAALARPVVLDLSRAPGAPLYPLPDACTVERGGAPSLIPRTSMSPLPMPRYGTRTTHRKAS
ncbi:MAG TPA: translesion DNA synthesis-associated protein ImuA [Casimicrobiaceae bacterium]|nr:translesion DNA synthesis-associated protein ImuA [Casimicrobiaceae bacterium]